MIKFTDRQLQAFWEFRTALEYMELVKSLPNPDQNKVIWAAENVDRARKELEASIVDEFDPQRIVSLVKPVTDYSVISPDVFEYLEKPEADRVAKPSEDFEKIVFTTRKVKPLNELLASDIPRGMNPEDVASDFEEEK